jgi:hypothetical protein
MNLRLQVQLQIICPRAPGVPRSRRQAGLQHRGVQQGEEISLATVGRLVANAYELNRMVEINRCAV